MYEATGWQGGVTECDLSADREQLRDEITAPEQGALWKPSSTQEVDMAGPEEASAQLLDEHAWERAEVLLSRRIAGGPYDGGWVASADNQRGPLYFAVPDETLAVLGALLSSIVPHNPA